MALNQSPWDVVNKYIPDFLKNRYIFVSIVFLGWMLLFDDANIFKQIELSNIEKRYEADVIYYEDKIQQAAEDRAALEANQEKFAREKYYLKKKNEDVYIFE